MDESFGLRLKSSHKVISFVYLSDVHLLNGQGWINGGKDKWLRHCATLNSSPSENELGFRAVVLNVQAFLLVELYLGGSSSLCLS